MLFFSGLFAIGLSIYRDYGVTWDDPIQRQLGLATYDYVTGKTDSILQVAPPPLDNRYHNPIIELIEILPEKILHSDSLRTDFLLKHLTNFILSWIGFIFFYLLALEIFSDFRWALLSTFMLLLTPRIFAHCFFNSKDIPVLFLFAASVYCLIRWIKNPSWLNILALILVSGFLTGARVMGLMMPVLVLLAWIFLLVKRRSSRKMNQTFIVYLLVFPLAGYLFFPSIWQHPFTGIENAVTTMSHFPMQAYTLFMGKSVASVNTPWYFVPVWMAITFPIGWWLFFVTGSIALIIFLFSKSIKINSVHAVILFLWILIPIASIIILKPNLYDDGRHFYFLYVPIILIATFGTKFLFENKFTALRKLARLPRILALAVLLSSSIYLTYFMIADHPFQYAYFNFIGRKYANEDFEKDYWGISYRNALEYLAASDKSSEIKLCWTMAPCESNLIWLNDEDVSRIHWTNFKDCDYFVTIFKSHSPFKIPGEKIYEVNVQGTAIVDLYKMNPPNNYDLPIY
ncbi:MAG: ArnT family glycosyltransferase [Chitinophagales bacterium]